MPRSHLPAPSTSCIALLRKQLKTPTSPTACDCGASSSCDMPAAAPLLDQEGCSRHYIFFFFWRDCTHTLQHSEPASCLILSLQIQWGRSSAAVCGLLIAPHTAHICARAFEMHPNSCHFYREGVRALVCWAHPCVFAKHPSAISSRSAGPQPRPKVTKSSSQQNWMQQPELLQKLSVPSSNSSPNAPGMKSAPQAAEQFTRLGCCSPKVK